MSVNCLQLKDSPYTCLSVKNPEPATNELDMALIWLLLLGIYDGFVVVE